MCIRDSGFGVVAGNCKLRDKKRCLLVDLLGVAAGDGGKSCLLYTSCLPDGGQKIKSARADNGLVYQR